MYNAKSPRKIRSRSQRPHKPSALLQCHGTTGLLALLYYYYYYYYYYYSIPYFNYYSIPYFKINFGISTDSDYVNILRI